jgi:hypothetical protein
MSNTTYTVRKGDTFGSVSKALYGDEKVAAALSSVNDIPISSASDEISLEELKTPDKLWVLQDNPSGGMAILDAFQLKGIIIALEWVAKSILAKDWSNLFFITDVKKLKLSPKVLILANCCLTAITDVYPKSWLAQGTKWYIGWALPVDDKDAVDFAKAFYRRWMVTYKMESDKVRKAFNDVRGPYAQYRPRIFG